MSEFLVGYFVGMLVMLIVMQIMEYVHRRIKKEETNE